MDRAEWKIDYVLSYTLPLKYEPVDKYLPFIDQSMVLDRLRIIFEDYAVLGE